jgi:hypothetical protein
VAGLTPFLELIASARRAGLVLARNSDGQLVIRGPRAHEQIVRALLARKADVLAVMAVYNGEVRRLDWRREPILGEMQPCSLCHRRTVFIEPFDRRPSHKTCAEAAIRWGTTAARTRGERAA